jgi:hypothetical protein
VTEGGEVVAEASVQVSRRDPNWESATDTGWVVVPYRPRFDRVFINEAEYERQLAEIAADRARRRALDPYRLGIWGPTND